jgi:hypothetical protein
MCAAAIPASNEIWAFHRLGCSKTEGPAVSMRLDFLLRELQADSAAITLPDLTPLADQLQQAKSLAGRAAVDLRLCFVIAELGTAANPGPGHLGRNGLTAMVQRDRPQQRRSNFIRQQAGRSLTEH